MRLKRVTRDDLTITRERRGRGFTYRDATGVVVSDRDLRDRIVSLVIPPAWSNVCIAVDANAHIQCCGTDEAGRAQYIYHPDWERRRGRRKLEKLRQLTSALPRIRKRVKADLAAEAGTEALALAIAVALLDRTAMRVGREKYLEANGTRGAGTLMSRDIRVDGDDLWIKFPAKSGKEAEYRLTEPLIADAISRIKTLPGKRLLVWRDAEGRIRPLRTEAINRYLKEIAGPDVSAKDFRTLHASSRALQALAGVEPGGSDAARKRQISGVVREVAEFLRNTPMVCRKSYIAPSLFTLFDKGRLAAISAGATSVKGLSAAEYRLRAVLVEAG